MSDESFEKLALLILGWLLGLLAPAVVEGIKRRRENELGRTAIQLELRGIGAKFAMAAHTVDLLSESPVKPKIEWLALQLEAFGDSHAEAQRKILEIDDTALEQHYRERSLAGGGALSLQKYQTPLLDARVSALWSFDTVSQRTLLEIKGAIDIVGDIVDRATHFNNLTFQNLSPENHERVRKNVDGCYRQYMIQARRIVELIRKFNRC